jgi:hypothetical protein
MGSKKPQQVVQQQATIPGFLQPAATAATQEALNIFEGPTPQFFPGQTFVSPAAETEEALTLAAQTARAGSPLVSSAQSELQNIIQGRQINPFLGAAAQAATAPIFERFQSEILPGLTSAFERAGRTGSPASLAARERATTALSRGVSETAARLAQQSAEAEAARQFAGIQVAPQLRAAEFADINRLGQVGAARERIAGAQLQDQINRFNFEQQAKALQLNQLINQLQGIGSLATGRTQTSGTVGGPSQTGAMVGGLLGGGLGAAFGGPFGAITGLGFGSQIGGLF